MTKHQTKIWESSEEEEGWVRENTWCAFASFAIQLSKASFSWEQTGSSCPCWKARSALSLPASHLDHQGTASFLTFSSGRFFGGLKQRQRCGKPNADVEMTGKRKNFCMFYFVACCPKFIMVNACTGRLQVKIIHKASSKFLSGPVPAFVHLLSLSYSTFPPNLGRKFKSVYIKSSASKVQTTEISP